MDLVAPNAARGKTLPELAKPTAPGLLVFDGLPGHVGVVVEEAAATAPPPSGPPCGCPSGDGDYCGLALIDVSSWRGCPLGRASGNAVDEAHLYGCIGGVLTEKRACSDCFTGSSTTPTGSCRP